MINWTRIKTLKKIAQPNVFLTKSAIISVTTEPIFMFAFEWTQPTEDITNGWICGYVPDKIWRNSDEDKRILVRSKCTVSYSSLDDYTPNLLDKIATSIEASFSSCQSPCFNMTTVAMHSVIVKGITSVSLLINRWNSPRQG